MNRLTENLTDRKLAINEIIKKIEQIKCEPLRRKNMEDTILIDKCNKKLGRAIIKDNNCSYIYQVKRTLREKYVVFLNKEPINYKIFYQKFKDYGQIKDKENIIRELRNRFEERTNIKNCKLSKYHK